MEFIIIQVWYSQQMGTNAIKKTVTHNSQEEEDGMSCKATQASTGVG